MKNVEKGKEMRIQPSLKTCGDLKIVFWDVAPYILVHVQIFRRKVPFILLCRPRCRREKNIMKNLQQIEQKGAEGIKLAQNKFC
jgi:hypothetical protein